MSGQWWPAAALLGAAGLGRAVAAWGEWMGSGCREKADGEARPHTEKQFMAWPITSP